MVVPDGTVLRIRVNQRISVKTSHAGDSFDGTIVSPVAVDGAPDSAPPIDDAGIATPRLPVDGADAAIDVGWNTETLNEYRPATVLSPPDCDQNIVSLTL